MNANDKNVKGSKFSGNKKSTFMIIIILILVIFIGVEIAALVKSGKNRNNPSPTDVAIATATQAPADNTEQTEATPTPATDNTQEPVTCLSVGFIVVTPGAFLCLIRNNNVSYLHTH